MARRSAGSREALRKKEAARVKKQNKDTGKFIKSLFRAFGVKL